MSLIKIFPLYLEDGTMYSDHENICLTNVVYKEHKLNFKKKLELSL